MDNRKIAKILIKLQMDDLKDADMLCEYAGEVSTAGDTSTASALYSKAKTRLNSMAECQKHIDNVMQRIRDEASANGEVYDDLYQDMYGAYISDWAEKIRMKLENY